MALSAQHQSDVNIFTNAVRSHWGIENNLHYCLDASFREDNSRIRTANTLACMGIIRHIRSALRRKNTKLHRMIAVAQRCYTV